MATAALRASCDLNTEGAGQAGDRSGALPDPRKAIRRRANLKQGFALEALGHAVEYLVDSRLFNQNDADAHSDQEAIQVLMRMSRAVFAECDEVLPLRRRMGRWIAGGWTGRSARKAPDPTAAGR